MMQAMESGVCPSTWSHGWQGLGEDLTAHLEKTTRRKNTHFPLKFMDHLSVQTPRLEHLTRTRAGDFRSEAFGDDRELRKQRQVHRVVIAGALSSLPRTNPQLASRSVPSARFWPSIMSKCSLPLSNRPLRSHSLPQTRHFGSSC